MKIKSKDMKLLVVALSALILVLMFRLAILPAMDAYEAEKIVYEEKSAQADEIQRILDAKPSNEAQIAEGLGRLDEMSDSCYVMMENRQIDELVTGAALAHSLFPSHLSISEQTVEIAPAYLYSAGGHAASNEAVDDPATTAAEATASLSGGETEDIDTEGTGPEAGQTEGVGAEAAIGMAEGAVRKVEASIAMNGSESNMKAFLNDIEKNYPAVHVKSFEMSESLYMSTELKPITETQMNVVLEIYMYSRPVE